MLTTGAGSAAHAPQAATYEAASALYLQQGAQMAASTALSLGSWDGAGSTAMAATSLPQVAWHDTVGAFAQKAAKSIEAAGTAHSTAVASHIPYPKVMENRARLMTLHATNFLGFNTPAIIATEAEYGEYWAQNAAVMMGYHAAATGIVSALAVPLPPPPLGANPVGMAAGIAAVAGQAAASGVQGLGAGLSEGTGAVSSAGSTAGGVAAGAALFPGVVNASQAGKPPGQAGGPAEASTARAPMEGAQFLQQAQALMGSATSAPSALQGAAAPLSQLGELPSMVSGQLGGVMGPMMSAVGAPGLGGGPGAATTPGSLAALGGANGGYAAGGSPVSAALTKPSAGGGGMAGPVGLPASWWGGPAAGPGATDKPVAGARAGAPGTGAMGPGFYGTPAAGAAGSQSRKDTRSTTQPDKTVVLDHGDAVPVLTDDGVIYSTGQGV